MYSPDVINRKVAPENVKLNIPRKVMKFTENDNQPQEDNLFVLKKYY